MGAGVTTGLVVSVGALPAGAASVRTVGPASADRTLSDGAAPDSPTHRLTIDPAVRHQRLDGFGASGSWWSQYLGAWSAPRRDRVARLLFSRTRGIGLSQYRYNVGGGLDDTIDDPWRTAETFETGRGTYDWSRDAAARRFLQLAKQHGVEDFTAFVNSPPRRLTANGRTYGDPGTSNLPPEHHEEFTDYLIDIVRHFRDEEGIDFRHVSPINEPQWSWDGPGQEGCHYEPEQVRDLTATVIEAFAASDLDTLVSAPEAGEYASVYSDQDYAGWLLEDEAIRDGLGEFATHSYWSTDEQRELAAQRMAEHPQAPLAMTEWCEMVGGRDAGMDSALVLARTVHADLTIANATAWQYWIAVSRYDYRDGLIYTDFVAPGDEETIEETQRLWALGNYSRFLRPGARRIGLEVETAERTEGAMARIPFVVPQIATGTSPGDRIFLVEDPAGDDRGPGEYTYPGNEAFTPGSFDLLSVEAVDDGDDVLLAVRLGTDLEDPWGDSPVGYDLQNIDIYVDTGADGGFTELLPGRRALVADGFSWDRAVFASGRTDVVEQDVAEKVTSAMREALFVPLAEAQSVDGDTLTLRVPKSFLGEMRPGWALQVVVTGSEGSMAADSLRVREVHRNASEWNFGGGSDGDEDPNILDLLVPEGMTQAEALAWTPATRVDVLASAYLDEETGNLVVVTINEAAEEREIELCIPLQVPSLRLSSFRTADGEALARGSVARLDREEDGLARTAVTLLPRSITTFTAPWARA
ncbi:glycoside hydrolase [Brachybacterium sp. AOP43-C2-M15]|uniref:glycoside hydrolase n=1 Tax=Brachybacterium sp. AOP43-C2-M15 TaxID=3457661 RepID=UPI004033475E